LLGRELAWSSSPYEKEKREWKKGSIATKLVERLTLLPLILAGKRPAGKKLLLALDGSEGSWHVSEPIGWSDKEETGFKSIHGSGDEFKWWLVLLFVLGALLL